MLRRLHYWGDVWVPISAIADLATGAGRDDDGYGRIRVEGCCVKMEVL